MDRALLGIVVLAAGESSRLGRPKQLLTINGKTLLRHTIETATSMHAGAVVVVVGANGSQIVHEAAGSNIEVVTNPDWQEGIASSIRCGLDAVRKKIPGCEAVLIMVCDQPLVTTTLLQEIADTALETDADIVASGYGDVTGVPALFKSALFPELQLLTGDTGARALIRRHPDAVVVISFEGGAVDIDTPDDYERLQN